MPTPLLEAWRLTVARQGKTLLAELNFELSAGAALIVQGANGSGKSTLLSVLATLRAPASGRLLWQGVDVAAAPLSYRAEMRYIGHENALKARLSALENLRWQAALHGGGDPRAALALAGLSRRADALCGELSAGQKRKVALAALLLSPTRLWLLDEPFAGLDEAAAELLGEWIAAHRRRGGAVALSAHRRQLPVELPGARCLALRSAAPTTRQAC